MPETDPNIAIQPTPTLRDQFGAAALAGLVSRQPSSDTAQVPLAIAKAAWAYADAMMQLRGPQPAA